MDMNQKCIKIMFTCGFQDSLQDIERALKVGYAENLKYKLYFRKGECLSKLNKCCESIDAYKLALTYLEKADCISLSRRGETDM